MKKIMFNDRYGLTEAVLSGRKTMTRRIVPINLYNQTDWKAVKEGDFEAVVDGEGYLYDIRECGMYRKGEVVAVAQKYSDCWDYYEQQWKQRDDPENWHTPDAILGDAVQETKGWGNKMFVRADLMPHHIRITHVGIEPLQEISGGDCLKEGVQEVRYPDGWKYIAGGEKIREVERNRIWSGELKIADKCTFENARKAFAALIDKISGKGTWESNPWVFVYSFELID